MTHQELKQESQSGDNQTARWWLQRLIVIAVVLVVLLTASFFTVRHIWGWDIGHYCIQKALNSPQPSRSLRLYRLALLWNPDRTDARANRVALLIQTKQFKRALRECDEWIKVQPNEADAYARKAWILLELARPDEALATFDKLIELKYDPNVHTSEAWTLLDQGRADELLATFHRVITLQSNQARGYIGKGDVYFQQKEFDKALAEYDKAIERGGGKLHILGEGAYAKRATVHLELGDYEQALADYSRAIDIETEATKEHEKWALKTAKQHPSFDAEQSILLQRRFLAQAYASRANAYSRAGRSDKAIVDIKKALELDTENKKFTMFYKELGKMNSKKE